jgi:hypothetical protein
MHYTRSQQGCPILTCAAVLNTRRLRRVHQFAPPPASATRLQFAAACADAVRAHAPQLMEEVDGTVVGGGFAPDQLKALVLYCRNTEPTAGGGLGR